jgi:hypothetical protein
MEEDGGLSPAQGFIPGFLEEDEGSRRIEDRGG